MLWIAEWVSVGSGSRRLEVNSHFYWLILGKISKSTNFRFLFSGMGKKTHSVFFPVHCEDEMGFQFGESFLKRLPRALLSKVISCSQLPETHMWLRDHFHFILPFPNIFPNVSKSQLPSAFPRNLQQVLIFPLQKKKKKVGWEGLSARKLAFWQPGMVSQSSALLGWFIVRILKWKYLGVNSLILHLPILWPRENWLSVLSHIK